MSSFAQSFHKDPSSPPTPFYAESPETSRQLFKAATTPSPRIKRRRRDSTKSRSITPLPEDSRSIQGSSSPSRIAAADPDDNIFAPKGKGKEVPSGFGLGLGIPVFSNDPEVNEPVIAWRFSEVSKQSSFTSPNSPSPTESIDGDTPVPPGDRYSIYTLTPGPAWPPPPSTDVSPEITPRNSLDAHDGAGHPQRGSGGSSAYEGMPLSPMTPAITMLLDEISTMDRPPSANAPKPVTTVQAWVMDMPSMEKSRKGRGEIRVRKMRSWRNLRALGTRTSQFELLREAVGPQSLPSPPITPPAEGQEQQQQDERVRSIGYAQTTPRSVLPDSPVENPFYDDYEDIIEAHLDLQDEYPEEQAVEDRRFPLDSSPEVQRQPQDWYQEEEEEIEEQETPRPAQTELANETFGVRSSPPQSPATQQGTFDPMTPDPNSDLVNEIEALLRSSPLRKKQLEEEAEVVGSTSTQAAPPQVQIIASTPENTEDEEPTPRQLQPPTFPLLTRSATQESLDSQATNDTAFFTPTEARTPLLEITNPMEPIPPVPTEARPQTPPLKATASISSSHSTPTRPPIPARKSSLSHSRNQSSETIPTKSYPPTSHRPAPHVRGKSIDSSSVYNDRGRTDPPPAQRQRSSSANAVTDELARGRVRSRSIDDGPPPIPARKSSVGKTGLRTQLLDTWLKKGSTGSPQRPSLASVMNSHKTSDESVERVNSNRFSFSSGVEVLGVGEQVEVVNTGVVASGSVKEVLVRTGSKGTKAAEFPQIEATSPVEPAKKPEHPTSAQHFHQFSFGEGPDLSFGEGGPSYSGKGKGKAKDQTFTPLPVVFQLIPPTPAANEEASTRNRQLGYQQIPIPSTPQPEHALNGPLRRSTPNPLAGVPVVHVQSASESTPSIPLPPRLPSVVNEVTVRPATAPEPLIDFENTTPSMDSPKRPSLKNRPTGFKKSKLSPWWKPKYSYFGDPLDYPPGSYHYDGEEYRPHTTSGFLSRVTSNSAGSVTGKRKKSHRTMSLGKVQFEFVGVKGLRESYKERKEVKRRRKALAEFQSNQHTIAFDQPPRLEVRI
ncbi:hypothetical protein ABW20_dc0102568 [Dactylellina cionopaga]|nr:hypothetical protein ABW20_dc0102568 [Dactylellina cionopaga]